MRLAVPYSMLMDRWAKARSRARMEWKWSGGPVDSKGKKLRTAMDEYERDDYSYFEAISNYYSVPWDRKSVSVHTISKYLWKRKLTDNLVAWSTP